MSASVVATPESGPEDCVLNRGHWFHLRPIGHGDRVALSEAFHRLSPVSRYRRFCNSKKALTETELRFFTELDGVDHCALGAFEIAGYGGEGELVGVARYIRLAEGCEVAEVAITVIDDFQSRGLARLLLDRLALLALQNGIDRFRFYYLADNEPMRALVGRPCWQARFSNGGSLLAAECELTDILQQPRDEGIDTSLDDLLHWIASGSVAAPLGLSLVAGHVWWTRIRRGLDLWYPESRPTRH